MARVPQALVASIEPLDEKEPLRGVSMRKELKLDSS